MSESPNSTPSPSPPGSPARAKKPVVAIYSTFLQRAYDQLIHDIALQNLPVVLAIDRAGLVGADGATHHGAFDLSYLQCIPNMVIMAPADENECRQMLYTAFMHHGPTAVRYPARLRHGRDARMRMTALPMGRGEIRRDGKRVAILASAACWPGRAGGGRGTRRNGGQHAFRQAAGRRADPRAGRGARVAGHGGGECGDRGVGSEVSRWLANEGIATRTLQLGLPDAFIDHGEQGQLQGRPAWTAKAFSD